MPWVVERLKFDESTLLWVLDTVILFPDSDSLIAYFEAQSEKGVRYMHRVTRLTDNTTLW